MDGGGKGKEGMGGTGQNMGWGGERERRKGKGGEGLQPPPTPIPGAATGPLTQWQKFRQNIPGAASSTPSATRPNGLLLVEHSVPLVTDHSVLLLMGLTMRLQEYFDGIFATA